MTEARRVATWRIEGGHADVTAEHGKDGQLSVKQDSDHILLDRSMAILLVESLNELIEDTAGETA